MPSGTNCWNLGSQRLTLGGPQGETPLKSHIKPELPLVWTQGQLLAWLPPILVGMKSQNKIFFFLNRFCDSRGGKNIHRAECSSKWSITFHPTPYGHTPPSVVKMLLLLWNRLKFPRSCLLVKEIHFCQRRQTQSRSTFVLSDKEGEKRLLEPNLVCRLS